MLCIVCTFQANSTPLSLRETLNFRPHPSAPTIAPHSASCSVRSASPTSTRSSTSLNSSGRIIDLRALPAHLRPLLPVETPIDTGKSTSRSSSASAGKSRKSEVESGSCSRCASCSGGRLLLLLVAGMASLAGLALLLASVLTSQAKPATDSAAALALPDVEAQAAPALDLRNDPYQLESLDGLRRDALSSGLSGIVPSTSVSIQTHTLQPPFACF